MEPTLGCQELGAVWGRGMEKSSCVFWGGEDVGPFRTADPQKEALGNALPGCLFHPSRIHPLCCGSVEHGVQIHLSKTVPCPQKYSTQYHQARAHRWRTHCLCHSSISLLRFSSGGSCKGTTEALQSCAMCGAFAITRLLSMPLEQLYGELKSPYQSRAPK